MTFRLLGGLCLALPLLAQIPFGPAAAPAAEEKPVDSLGRSNPRSSIYGFLKAVQAGRYRTAAQFLDLGEARRESQGPALARDLQLLFDAAYNHPLSLVSDRPEGSRDEGLDPVHDRAGEIVVDDEAVDVVLVRRTLPDAGDVWLIGQETLSRVPGLAAKLAAPPLVRNLPDVVNRRVLGISLWQWAGAIGLFFICLAIGAGVVWLLRRAIQNTRLKTAEIPSVTTLVIALGLHSSLLEPLAIPLLYRSYYRRAIGLFFLVGFTWILFRVIDQVSAAAQQRALASGKLAANSWLILSRRMLKVLVAFAAGLAFFSALGFNISTALAGLGIGGIAIAFAAQKTLENLFGGVSVASDQVIRVGDTCNFNGRIGTVTDIGLRSTRIRTLERTELSIPNGVLATMTVENFTLRDKFLFNPVITLRYETTQAQLQEVLLGIRDLFARDPRVEDGGRVRLSAFADSSVNIEIFVYLMALDFNTFAEIREDLLLKIQQIVLASGTSFAFPSRSVYVEGKGPLSKLAGPANSEAD
jgi:MscS family membrane protein